MRFSASARSVRANVVWLAALCGLAGAGSIAPAHAQNAVCADVKIEIKQKLSLERHAFDAVMRINNGLQTDAIQNVGINLNVQDQVGNGVVATSDPNNTSASLFPERRGVTNMRRITC
jgi:hypothetical protein